MTYKEARKRAINMEWKIDTCPEGEKCWCRKIVPIDEVNYTDFGYDGSDYKEKYEIVSSGAVGKDIAERIVNDHNLIIKQQADERIV